MSDETLEIPVTGVANVADLIPYFNNPRSHTDLDIDRMIGSINAFGFRIPVLVKQGVDGPEVIDGHLRLKAAEKLGLEKVPVLYADDMSDEQVRAFRIMVNQSVSWADWDNAKLHEELQLIAQSELAGMHSLEAVSGFEKLEIGKLAALAALKSGLTDPDVAPPVPEKPVTELGDIWVLGKHRLVCGDSTDPDTVQKCLNGAVPHLMVTDPPYGVNYDPAWRLKAGIAGVPGESGAALGKVLNDDKADWTETWKLFPGSVVYIWHSSLHAVTVMENLKVSGFQVRAQICWVKQRAVLSRGNYHWQHETAFYATAEGSEPDDHWHFVPEHEVAEYAVKDGNHANWKGNRKQSTVWFIEHLKSDTGHGTQKPVECMKRPMENNSMPGQAVYDPFVGSGTTIIAGEMTGRSVHAIELDPGYCDVCVARWQAFTGEQAHIDDSVPPVVATDPDIKIVEVAADG